MYKKQTDQHPTKKLLHGDVTEYVIQPLLPCEKVTAIAVAACNFVGWGKHTQWRIEGITTRRVSFLFLEVFSLFYFFFDTKKYHTFLSADLPSRPTEFRMVWAAKTTVTLGWEKPTELNGDDIRKYEVRLGLHEMKMLLKYLHLFRVFFCTDSDVVRGRQGISIYFRRTSVAGIASGVRVSPMNGR